MLKLITTCSYVLVFQLSVLIAQETTVTAGGEISGSGGSVSYSVGQTFYTTSQEENYSITEGIIQPYEISVVSIYTIPNVINIECNAFPNPTNDYLILNIENPDQNNLNSFSYLLFDTDGKLLTNKNKLEPDNKVDLSSYQQGTYFLNVLYKNKNLKNFKIIKY